MRHLLATCTILLVGSTLASGEIDGTLGLPAVLEQARRDNPELRAARERASAAAALPARVTAYDDPTFSYEAWNTPDPNPFRVDRADNNILRLSQKIPFPGKRTLAGRAAEHDADVSRRDVDAVELDVVAAVTRAFYDLWEAHQLLGVYARDQALVRRLAHVAQQKYAVSEVSQSDVLRAQVELTRLTNRLTTQELRIDGARAALNVLLSRAPDAPLGAPADPPPARLEQSVETLTDLALHSRPELAGRAAAIAREESGVQLARRNLLPDFEFTVGRFINPGQRDGFGAMAAVSIPIAYRAKYDAAVAEAQARRASAQAELRRLEDRVRGDVREAYLRARAALLQRDLFVTTHVPQAEQALRVTESGYQAGAVDFLALVDTARTIESVHVEHLAAEADFERAHADLERAVGRELPRETRR
jgi:outer membrane protein TolC